MSHPPPPPGARPPPPPPKGAAQGRAAPPPPGGSAPSPSRAAAAASPVPPRSRSSSKCAVFDESRLPSVLRDGITPAEERQKRRRTCRFIEECARALRLPRIPVATAEVFLHRFYAKHSFAEHDRFEVAVACVLLAAKTEESPKKLTTVIQECYRVKNRAAAKQRSGSAGSAGPGGASPRGGGAAGLSPGPMAGGGLSPSPGSSSGDRDGLLDTKGEEYLRLKERILLLERVILHTIGFELSVDHPYKFLVDQIKTLNQKRQLEYISPPSSSSSSSLAQRMNQELLQSAMNFANDSMHTSLCLQFPAQTVGTMCVYLAGRNCKIRPAGGTMWTDVLGIDAEDLACGSLQIVELIADKKGCDFMKISSDMRKELDMMRDRRSGGSGSSGVGGRADVKRPRYQ